MSNAICKCGHCRFKPKPTFPDTVENLRGEVEMWKGAFKKYAQHQGDCCMSIGACSCGLNTYLNLLEKD